MGKIGIIPSHLKNNIPMTYLFPTPNGAVKLSISGDPGRLYLIEGSTDLAAWAKRGVRTNVTGTVTFLDSNATNFNRRFYRLSGP